MGSLVKNEALGSVLVRSRIISEEDIKAALDEQRKSGCRFGEALVKLGIVTQEDIDWALSSQLNIPYVRLKQEMIDSEAVDLVPESVARKYNLIPIFRAGDEIGIALADPLNEAAVAAVEQLTGCRVVVSIPFMRELREMLDIFYGPSESGRTFGFSSPFFPENIIERINSDTSGSRFLDLMLLYIIKNRLDSISLQPLGGFVSVVGRQGRVTREIGRLAITNYPDLLMYIRKQGKVRAYTDSSARGVFEYSYKDEPFYFRILTLRGQGGDYVTFKLHVPVNFPGNYDELELPGEIMSSFREMLSRGQGMVLFSAATIEECSRVIDLFLQEYDTSGKTVFLLGDGAGKSIKRFPNIFLGKGSVQEMQSVVAAVLEHDPDILVFEDAGSADSFHVAAFAAMRGKIVLCGSADGNVSDVIERLLEFRHNCSILSQIRGVVSFRAGLIPCGECLGDAVAGEGEDCSDVSGGLTEIDKMRGCRACEFSGFTGRKFKVDAISFTENNLEEFSSCTDTDEVLQRLEGKGYFEKWNEWNELITSGGLVPAEFDFQVDDLA